MNKNIQPNYEETTITCACGNVMTVGSTKKEMKVAILPVGYQDGIIMTTKDDCFRMIDHLRYIYNDVKNIFRDNSFYVRIKDKKYKALGRIGMYNIVVDVGNDDINIGDEVFIDTKIMYIDSKIRREYI